MLEAPRYTPYDKGRFQLTLGIKAIDRSDWIEVDDHYSRQIAEKRRLLSDRPADVFGALPESLDAQGECLETLLAHLQRDRPGLVRFEGDSVTVAATGARYRLADFAERPLDLAGRLVQEDLCLMAPADGTWRLVAASLCFPSRWRLADKLGRPMAAIHEPVPGFNERLARPVDRFFDRVEPGQLFMRLNWSVIDDPTLFQPSGHGRGGVNAAITAENAGETTWLRIERQTIVRLPESGVLVFGIKTVIDPLSVLADRPALAAALRDTLAAMPDDMRRYKSVGPFADALAGWLERVAAAA